MASWLTPRHLDDGARVLRGVALVLARVAADRYGYTWLSYVSRCNATQREGSTAWANEQVQAPVTPAVAAGHTVANSRDFQCMLLCDTENTMVVQHMDLA